jgi:hypothetical protein
MGYQMGEADKVAIGITLVAAAALLFSTVLAVLGLVSVDSGMVYKAGFILLFGLAAHFWMDMAGG